MSWISVLNFEVVEVIASFAGFGLVCLYALLAMLVRRIQGEPVSGLPPKGEEIAVAETGMPPTPQPY
ncbi:hypothetical protein [Streptomyces sp. NPDC046759]|uniref:hypothetical protein n=1 Tax=Streptomyces sp. NPDC046759 TaxID=3155019 RepID=UPI0033DFAAC5